MKFKILFLLFTSILVGQTQNDSLLIVDDGRVALYDTYISVTSKENIYPSLFDNNLIYFSKNNSDKYELKMFKNDTIQKLKASSKLDVSKVAIYKNEIYFTQFDFNEFSGQERKIIYYGIIEKGKIKKKRHLKIIGNGVYNYSNIAISKNGEKMVMVSNQRGVDHLVEFNRNENNEWERGNVIFINQLNFKIINPFIYDENTIYFSSNVANLGLKEIFYEQKDDEIKVDKFTMIEGDFNIYKITKENNNWMLPVPVDELNSIFDDLGVIFTSENSGYINTFRFDNTDNIFYFKLN